MASVGEMLRGARLEQGLQLSVLSARTKIGMKFLEAIEADDRQGLPGGFFYRSWAQQYARSLDLDMNLVTAAIDRILIAEQPPALPGEAETQSSALRPAPMRMTQASSGGGRLFYPFALLVIVVLGCSGFYTWWHRLTPAAADPAGSGEPAQAPATQPLAQPRHPVPEPSPPPSDPAPSDSASTDPAAAAASNPTTSQLIGAPDRRRSHRTRRRRRSVASHLSQALDVPSKLDLATDNSLSSNGAAITAALDQ